MPLQRAARIPAATYRLQLSREWTFADVHDLVPHLDALGVDTLYLSPILLSAPGSTHGYDVNDYRRIDPELGGRSGFERLSDRLKSAGAGVLLDFVPNHMGIDGPFNAWWRDVLEAGEDSPYARFFDVFWTAQPRTRIHLPVLEDHYGRELEAGKLRLQYDRGELSVAYGQTTFPLSLNSYAKVLKPVAADPACPDEARAALAGWHADAAALARASTGSTSRRHREARATERAALKTRLAALVAGAGNDDAAGALGVLLGARLQRLNGAIGHPRSFDALHVILEKQHYRLARWQTGAYESNYRRFFAIDSLVGLRIEHPDVFRDSHALVQQLLADGQIQGLRIDHIDGLWDPQEYLERVQRLAPDSRPSGAPLYVVVEKILTAGETVPDAWPVHGTTGYEFIDAIAGLFVDASAEERFSRLYEAFAGARSGFHQEAYASKRIVEDDVLANTTMVLAIQLNDLIERDRRWRDLSRSELRTALREIMASLRVYRTYRRLSGAVRPEDRREIDEATQQAIRRNPLLSTEAFDFVRAVLLGEYPPPDAPAEYRNALMRWTLTFQQHTGAVMAKAMEDRAFYTFNRFVALNEVGGDPGRFGRPVDDFHRFNAERRAGAPHGLNASSTHDTKMSEDVRARLYALSEIGDEWEAWVREWAAINRGYKAIIDGDAAPDANEEYRLYQLLIGVWPLEAASVNDEFRARIRACMQKGVNEAHVHSAWSQPNAAWLSACDAFVDAMLSDAAGRGFLESMQPKAARVAELGMVNALAATALKILSPGVPDFYQGAEGWLLSLVDPDNRQPVDFARLTALAADVARRSWRDLLQRWRDGGVKLRLTRDLLAMRRSRRAFFEAADYRALPVRGAHADHVVAFARTRGDETLVVAVPRLSARMGSPALGDAWDDTTIDPGRGDGAWRHLLTNAVIAARPALAASDLFAELPIAVLTTA